jgi:RNA polymerase sigma-70 factor (ECF subfamily)
MPQGSGILLPRRMTGPDDLEDVTALLTHWRAGDALALERLVGVLYADLRRVARAHLRREEAHHSLQATALVHEVYLRLVKVDRLRVADRAHFIAVAARLMRQILVDHARRRHAARRGGSISVVSLDAVPPDAEPARPGVDLDLLALDQALSELASFDARQCRIVEMKFFGGLTIDEMAEALGLSAATVERDWVIARAWLYDRLSATP